MKDRDLRPLLDPGADTPAEVRDALEAARACLPRPADLSAIAAGLPLGHGPGGSGSDPEGESSSPGEGGGGPHTPPALATPSMLPGVLVGAALGAVVSVVGLAWPRAAEPPPSPSVPGASSAPLIASISSAAPTPTQLVAASSVVRAARPPAQRAPAVLNASDASPTPPQASASAPVAVAPAGGVAPEAEGESEVRLLQRAKDALAASPGQALSLAEQHAARFPGGVLAQEREVVAIKAFLALGRTGDARARAARFVAAHPGSAHRPGVEALLGP